MNPLTGEDLDHRKLEALPKEPWTATFRFHASIPAIQIQEMLYEAGLVVGSKGGKYEVRPK